MRKLCLAIGFMTLLAGGTAKAAAPVIDRWDTSIVTGVLTELRAELSDFLAVASAAKQSLWTAASR